MANGAVLMRMHDGTREQHGSSLTASQTLRTILEQDLQALLAGCLQQSELEVSTGRVLYSEPVMMELQ